MATPPPPHQEEELGDIVFGKDRNELNQILKMASLDLITDGVAEVNLAAQGRNKLAKGGVLFGCLAAACKTLLDNKRVGTLSALEMEFKHELTRKTGEGETHQLHFAAFLQALFRFTWWKVKQAKREGNEGLAKGLQQMLVLFLTELLFRNKTMQACCTKLLAALAEGGNLIRDNNLPMPKVSASFGHANPKKKSDQDKENDNKYRARAIEHLLSCVFVSAEARHIARVMAGRIQKRSLLDDAMLKIAAKAGRNAKEKASFGEWWKAICACDDPHASTESEVVAHQVVDDPDRLAILEEILSSLDPFVGMIQEDGHVPVSYLDECKTYIDANLYRLGPAPPGPPPPPPPQLEDESAVGARHVSAAAKQCMEDATGPVRYDFFGKCFGDRNGLEVTHHGVAYALTATRWYTQDWQKYAKIGDLKNRETWVLAPEWGVKVSKLTQLLVNDGLGREWLMAPTSPAEKALAGVLYSLADLEIIGMAGSGSFGKVFIVRFKKNPDAWMALKLIAVDLDETTSCGKSDLKNVVREVSAGSISSSPHIMPVLGHFMVPEVELDKKKPMTFGLLLELAAGDLHSIITSSKFRALPLLHKVQESCHVMKQVLEGVRQLRQAGIGKIGAHFDKCFQPCADFECFQFIVI